MCCAACQQGHIQRSTSGPAGSRTWGLAASAQWLYPDDPGRGDSQRGRRFSVLIHDMAAISTAFCSGLICPASPTHKYFTNTSHTRDLAERPHRPHYHAPSLLLFHSLSLFDSVSFISSLYSSIQQSLSLSSLFLALFHLSRDLQVHGVWGKLLTEDKMLRAVDPHSILCN